MTGPRSQLARYAYGYSDRPPSMNYWLIILIMLLFILYNIYIEIN